MHLRWHACLPAQLLKLSTADCAGIFSFGWAGWLMLLPHWQPCACGP